MTGFQKIGDRLAQFAATHPDAPVMLSPGRATLTYGVLQRIVQNTAQFLTDLGLGGNDRIATALNGMEMACAFFSITNIATIVPLDPNYSVEQFRFYLQRLKVKALIVQEGHQTAARQAVRGLGIALITVTAQGLSATDGFALSCQNASPGPQVASGKCGDEPKPALIGFSSGTIGNPKIIPKSHLTLGASAESRMKVLRLTPDDRGLIVTPMFRGLSLNFLMAGIVSGGSLVCADGFEAGSFFKMLNAYAPTWFISNAAILQAIVEYAEKNEGVIARMPLRLIAFSGAPLSPKLEQRLSRLFGIPVSASYGLSEVSFVACNYLAPRGYKEGSVGPPIGCELAIMGEHGELLPVGAQGEVVIKGPNVFSGYENDPEANQQIFCDGWFKTGDLGWLDLDGYLFVTGRIKELINRGGEKIAPYELEKAIIQAPSVEEVVVFACPHPTMGEEVAALVVLAPGSTLDLKTLRGFLKGQVTAFKMPTKLFRVDAIPRLPAGKVPRNRIGGMLQELNAVDLSEMDADAVVQPGNETEAKLVAIWQAILKKGQIGIFDNFFDLGGDSILATELSLAIEDTWGYKIPLNAIFEDGTIADLAGWIQKGSREQTHRPFLVPIQPEGDKRPLFCFHPADGEPVVYQKLAVHLGMDQPLYGLRFNPDEIAWVHPFNLADVAESYLRDIRSIQPEGPYLLAGFCVGGIIAYEVACRLERQGQDVAVLALFDGIISSRFTTLFKLVSNLHNLTRQELRDIPALVYLKLKRRAAFYRRQVLIRLYRLASNAHRPRLARWMDKEAVLRCSRRFYRPRQYSGRITFFQPEAYSPSTIRSLQTWKQLAGHVKVVITKGGHNTLLQEPNVAFLAQKLRECLEDGRLACNCPSAGSRHAEELQTCN